MGLFNPFDGCSGNGLTIYRCSYQMQVNCSVSVNSIVFLNEEKLKTQSQVQSH